MSIVAATPSPRLSAMPMAPSSSDNMLEAGGSGLSPVTKRKIEDDNRADGKENGQPKRVKVESATSILDLPKRKVTFVQAPVTFDSSRRLKLDFEGSLLDAQDAKQEIANIPEEHWKYITLSGSELTSSTEALFINHLRKVLEPADLTGIITPSAWTSLIPKLFTLEQYGVLLSDLPSSTKRVPVALHIRAWEPKDQTYFTDEQRTILKDRREARIEARRQIEAALKALDDVELFELVKGEEKKDKKRIKPTPTDVNVQSSPAPSMDRKSREGTACSATGSRRSASPVKKALTAEEEEAMRIKLEEREAKRIAAEERKVAKEEKRQQKEREEAAKEQERQRKEAAMAKQKATMNSFFKPKVFGAPKIVAGPSKPREKDFDRIFKPVAMRPFVDWAPVNRFKPSSSIADSLNTKGKIRRGKLRTDAPFGTVGEKWEEYQDSPDPRAVLAQLNNKRKFPWKTLAFDQQTRPPYCGTFTKRSAVVGPRTPFAQDPLFDYSYDSGDDWQEDEGGEDVDDPEVEAELSDAESEQESEGEFDDWLDDESEAQMSDEDGDKQTKLQTKQAKRKEVKRVVKLAPFVKGPCWESSLGETDGMDVYRIQLLNDAPTGIDPFTYTSGPAQSFKTTYTTTSVGAQLAVKTLMSAEPRSTVDPAPVAPAATPAKMATADPAAAPKRAPKILFPDSHLAELLRLVEGNTKIQTDLVSQLKAHFEGVASKAAIEVKLKEVASRQGKSKESAWKVTDEAWRAAGLSPPSGPAGSAPAIVEQINGDVFS